MAKASLDGAKSTEGSSRPSASRSQGTAGPNPVTQSAKQFADAFSREVLKIDRERVNKNTKPRFQESIRIMPTSAWSKLYAAFPARATSPVKPEATASTQSIQSIPSKSAEVSAATVHKALHSIVPAQWSSFHRHWTCQKTVAEMIAIVAIQRSEIQMLWLLPLWPVWPQHLSPRWLQKQSPKPSPRRSQWFSAVRVPPCGLLCIASGVDMRF